MELLPLRFDVWPYLERFALDVEREVLAEMGGKPDLIIGNYRQVVVSHHSSLDCSIFTNKIWFYNLKISCLL